MRWRNTRLRFGALSKCLHWLVAVLLIGLTWLGWYLVGLSHMDRWFNDLLAGHQALGMIALALGAVKILWTLYDRPPSLSSSMRAWEKRLARTTHVILSAMMVAVPATGYLISTSAGDSVSVFGLLQVPALLPKSERLRDLAVELHYYLAYATLVLVLVHVAAALLHELVDRDGTLKRML